MRVLQCNMRLFGHQSATNKICREVRLTARKERRQGGQGFGGGGKTEDNNEAQSSLSTSQEAEQVPVNLIDSVSMGSRVPAQRSAPQPSSSGMSAASLPSISRHQILGTCVQTSALIAIMGFGLHQVAPIVSPAAHDGNNDTLAAMLQWPSVLNAEQLGVGAAVAGGVTAARLALLSVWSDFKSATDASNNQVLVPLSGMSDIAVVSLLPAVAEELLFRGALVPSIYPDWRGVAIAGLVFGALHINGGRNAAFGVWAGAVGCVYGAAFLATGNLLVPMAAHAAANVASATLWLQSRQQSTK